MKDKVEQYNQAVEGKTPEEIIAYAYEQFGAKLTFATSLGEEDQIITDMISKVQPEISLFTLDTGRLFAETYDLIAKIQERYPMKFDIYAPDTKALEQMVQTKGINLFYESVDNRKLCCGIRKVEPLKRALKNMDAWICGLRRSQSITRASLQVFEWDEGNNNIKISPLAYWSLKQVKAYIEENKVDINPLHKEGFVSIGCAPCTRAIKDGEDIRAGRWWWEEPEQKECGLHRRQKSEDR